MKRATLKPMAYDLDISRLTPTDCILLAEQLWERARAHADAIPVTEAQREELHRRLDASERGELPPGEPWEEGKRPVNSVLAWEGTLRTWVFRFPRSGGTSHAQGQAP